MINIHMSMSTTVGCIGAGNIVKAMLSGVEWYLFSESDWNF